MNELAALQNRLSALENELAQIKAQLFTASLVAYWEQLPAQTIVGKDYAAYRFGCSVRAVVRGEAGTHRLRRVSARPLKFIKSEVDAAWRAHTKPVSERAAEMRAAEMRANAKARRRRPPTAQEAA